MQNKDNYFLTHAAGFVRFQKGEKVLKRYTDLIIRLKLDNNW